MDGSGVRPSALTSAEQVALPAQFAGTCSAAPTDDRDRPAHQVALHGEVDLSSIDELSGLVARFVASDATDVDVDLAAVTFFDATGLSFLVRLRQACRDRGGVVTLLAPGRMVRRILNLVGLDTEFGIADGPCSDAVRPLR